MATDADRSSRAGGASGDTDQRGQLRTAVMSVFAACSLVALKLGTGLAAGSLGLVSAGIESSGDVVAAVLTVFAIRVGGRAADADHPYGHRRAENLGALGEAAILAGGGVLVVIAAADRLAHGGARVDTRWYVFAVVAMALVIDISRALVSWRSSAKYHSAALRSNAFHFAGDMAASLAVLAGLVAVRSGFVQGDSIASLIVAAIIFSASARLIYENARVLMDTSPADAYDVVQGTINEISDDIDLRRLRIRESGGRYFADAVVAVPPGQPVVAGEETAETIEAAVQRALPHTDIVVHLQPRLEGLNIRDRALAVALAEPLVRDVHDVSIYDHDGRKSVSLHLKMQANVRLRVAHEVAERVEARLREEPDVEDVHTHLEPLEQPVAARAETTPSDDSERRRITDLVARRTGGPPRELRLLRTDAGLVVFVSVGAGEDTGLADAHNLASVLEDDIREGQPHMADVVVHTEP